MVPEKISIALDLRPTEAGFKAHAGRGTGRYTEELVRHLFKLASGDDSCTLVPLHSGQFAPASWERRLTELLPFGRLTFESQVLYPRRAARSNADLVHFFAHGDASARPVIPQIVTVLDLIPLKFPELYKSDKPNWRFRFARWLEYQSICRASGIIAISEATKRDVVSLLGVPPEKVIVTPLAVSGDFPARPMQREARQGEAAVLRTQLGIPAGRPILLYVGGIDPRKNVLFLLDVLHGLLAERQPGHRPLLVLAGRIENDDQYPSLCRAIERNGLADDVYLTGFVPDDRLSALYRAADLFVFPSLYEGFGLPVLEAMASGCPVAAGRNSSIPEVSGEAGTLLPDKDTGAWVRALRELLEHPEKRDAYSHAGLVQARRFSWAATAEATLEAYHWFYERLRCESRASGRRRRHAAGG